MMASEMENLDSTQSQNTENGESQNSQESGDPKNKSDKLLKLPMSRVKALMKMDPDVTLASQDAVKLICKATELFLGELSKESYIYTSQGKRKTVQKKDMDNAVENIDALAFLEGALVEG